MKKGQAGSKGKSSSATDNRVEQRNQKQNQATQLSAANVEESPYMDRRDSGEGAGESLGDAPGKPAGESLRRGAVDTQYGTRSSMKPGAGGRASSGGSGTSAGAGSPAGADTASPAPNPGSSEESSGAERDTMTGPRPGSGS